MNDHLDLDQRSLSISRRSFLHRSAYGLGGLALGELLAAEARAGSTANSVRGVVSPPHYPIKAKRVIHLCMAGGPSQFESLDNKPILKKFDGQPFPESLTKGQQLAQLQNTVLKARGPLFEFSRHGQSGQEISSLFPKIAGIADEICIIRSMVTEQINHDPAQAFMNSGSILKGRPSMGSWLLYGLGAETENLPGFIVLISQGKAGGAQPVSARQWSSGFLPGKFQGVQFQSRGDAVHYIGNPEGVCQSTQRLVVEEIERQNGLLAEERYDPEIQTRIAQFEMAFRMQTSIPDLTDFSQEPREVLDLYGVKEPGDGSFASNCLLARRLAERGVRFVQLYHRAWDHHGDLDKNMPIAARETDQACAALVTDLKRRGMLDDTLIIWGGEFGRTPMGQGSGRDHHILSFSLWLAGGGIKGGLTFGASDEFGYRAVENVVTLHDLHATLLHLCGIDYHRFSVKFLGLDARLTGVEPCQVLKPILA
jgi:hypothetical protein